MNEAQRSALKTAVSEFLVVFVAAICWIFVRKTGESVLDAFGVAVVTAFFLYIVHRSRSASRNVGTPHSTLRRRLSQNRRYTHRWRNIATKTHCSTINRTGNLRRYEHKQSTAHCDI
jgi:hypothetical protein